MARLSDIATEIGNLIAGITIANGYSYDFGSINESDAALQTYPSADITYTSEVAASSTAAAQYGWCEAEFLIKIRSKLLTVETCPAHAIDADYDTIIHDIKTVLGISNHILALAYYPVMTYEGFTKEPDRMGDLFTPSIVIVKYKCFYHFDEQG